MPCQTALKRAQTRCPTKVFFRTRIDLYFFLLAAGVVQGPLQLVLVVLQDLGRQPQQALHITLALAGVACCTVVCPDHQRSRRVRCGPCQSALGHSLLSLERWLLGWLHGLQRLLLPRLRRRLRQDLPVGPVGLVVGAGLLYALGIYVINAELKGQDDHDPSWVVIDEVVGQWIALLPVAFGAYRTGISPLLLWPGIVSAFLLFRLFDIWKPWIIGKIDARGDCASFATSRTP